MWWIALLIWREVSIALIACIHNFYTQTDQHLYHCFKLGKGAHYEAMVPLDADEVDSTASSAAADGGSDDELNEVLGKSVDDDNDEDRESPLKVDTSGQFAYAIV